MRKVIWRKGAIEFAEEQLMWYEQEMGRKAAIAFLNGINKNIRRLCLLPDIGKREMRYKMSGATIRSLLLFKHYRLYYGYTETELTVIAIWDNRRIKK